VGQAVNGLAEVAQGAGSALSLRWSFGKPGCLGEEGRFRPRLRRSLAVYGPAKRPAAQPDETGTPQRTPSWQTGKSGVYWHVSV